MTASSASHDAADLERADVRADLALRIRAAIPADIPVVFEMKRQLAIAEGSLFALRATEQDWLRDGFGPDARFEILVGERDGAVVGMVTVSPRYYTGWAGSGLYIQDIYVVPPERRRGVASALLARVAADAVASDCPFVELTVAGDNPARRLYRLSGFAPVKHCAAYVLGGPKLNKLAEKAGISST